MRPSARWLVWASALGSVPALAAGCSGSGVGGSPPAKRCHLHTTVSASARTAHYRVIVGLAPERRIEVGQSTKRAGTAVERAVGASTLGVVHVDVRVCTVSGQPVALRSAPTLHLTDPALAGISIDVPLRRARFGETEAAHFGDNILAPGSDALVARVSIAGETATLMLRRQR